MLIENNIGKMRFCITTENIDIKLLIQNRNEN